MIKMKSKKDFGALFWIHLLMVLLAYLSPLWFDWKIILVGAVLLQVYYYFRGGCDITFWELGRDEDTTFVWYYLQKIFPKLDKKKTKIFLDYYLSFILVVS